MFTLGSTAGSTRASLNQDSCLDKVLSLALALALSLSLSLSLSLTRSLSLTHLLASSLNHSAALRLSPSLPLSSAPFCPVSLFSATVSVEVLLSVFDVYMQVKGAVSLLSSGIFRFADGTTFEGRFEVFDFALRISMILMHDVTFCTPLVFRT